ncbi:MAG: DNA primase [Clostridiales bacterium 43-6]|nr:MAG: DNA primase [Clostridiales bacterium 43-6]
MPLSEEFLTELRYRNSIETIVSSYVNLHRRGNMITGLCPFHNEKTPSFTLYPENNSFYCFGCGVGGDVITFIRDIENLDYMEAVRLLSDRSGLPMPDDGFDDGARRLRQTLLEINRETARFFHNELKTQRGRKAYEYLKDRRLTDDTIRHFGLGYSPDSFDALLNHLKSKGFREPDIVLANVVANGKTGKPYDRFHNRIMFPIIDLRGNVIAFGGRIMPGLEGAKYINTADTPIYKKSRNIYALNVAKNTKENNLILAEGYMDVISLHQAGFTNAVASLGTAFTQEQALLLGRYCKEIVVTLDADEAGQKATEKAIRVLSGSNMRVRVLRIDGGKDPDEYIREFGPDRFRALLEGAGNEIEYKLFTLRQKYDLTADSGKMLYLNEAAILLSELPVAIARDIYSGKLAKELEVSKEAILKQTEQTRQRKTKAEYNKRLKEFTAPKIKQDAITPEKREHPRAACAEEAILCLLMNFPDLKKEMNGRVQPEDFMTGFHRKVFETVEKQLENGVFDLTLISGEFSTQEMGRIVAIQNKTVAKANAINELADCIRILKDEKENSIIGKASEMETDQWAEALQKLRRQKGSSS